MSDTVVLGLNFLPDKIDVQNLRTLLAGKEVRTEDFFAYCVANNFELNAENEISAANFVAFFEGQRIAWLHLPSDNSGITMARILVNWAAANGMQLRDGSNTYESLTPESVINLRPLSRNPLIWLSFRQVSCI